MKIRKVARSFIFSIALILMLPVSSYAANVIADGKEWRQVTETVNTSWNTLAASCDTTTGLCGGAYDGWTWASKEDVQSLFRSYLVPAHTTEFTSYHSTPNVSTADGFLSLFEATESITYSSVSFSRVFGLTRTQDPGNPNAANFSYVERVNYASPFYDDYSAFSVQAVTSKTSANPVLGAWMYTTAAPVPEPEIYAMMGLGLGLMGWVGRRKRLKESVTV